ncbi:unnamed protein product [Sphagnum balticum]
MVQSASAVSYLHSSKPRPTLHRDIKPMNILLTHDYRRAKLADFGFARVEATEMTNKRGTVLWMAPEVKYSLLHPYNSNPQVFTGTQYSAKCDVYSLGVCVWEVLTGQLPYYDANGKGPDMRAFKNNVILWYTDATNRDPPLRPSPMPDVPEAPELIELIEEAWAKDPNMRPTAQQLHERLAVVLTKFPGGDAPLHVDA